MDDFKGRADRFLALFNQLEQAMKQRLGSSSTRSNHAELIRRMAVVDPVFAHYKADLDAFRSLRNAIVHNHEMDVWDPIAAPHPEALEHYTHLVRYILDPPTVESVAIPAERIFQVSLADTVLGTLATMEARSFGLAPVVEDGKLIGAFTETTLERAMVAEGTLNLDADRRIAALQKYVLFSDQGPQDVVKCAPNTSLARVRETFQRYFTDNRRLVAVLIADGPNNGTLRGLVTPHDLLRIPPDWTAAV